MPVATSVDLRTRIVDAYKRKEGSLRELAERFSVSHKSVKRYVRQERQTASLEPSSARRGPRPKIDADGLAAIEEMLQEQCDLTNAELVERLESRGIVKTSTSAVSRATARLGWSRKKNAVGR